MRRNDGSREGQVPVVQCVVIGEESCVSAVFNDLVARGITPDAEQQGQGDLTVIIPDQDPCCYSNPESDSLPRTARGMVQLGDAGGTTRRRVKVRLHRNRCVVGPEAVQDDTSIHAGGTGDIIMGRGGGGDDADAVVVVVMSSSGGSIYLDEMLSRVYHCGNSYFDAIANAATKARNLLLVDYGISTERKDMENSLAAAFSIGAFKLLNGIKKEGQPCTPPGLFRSILETARLPGYGLPQLQFLHSSQKCIESVLPPGTGLEIMRMSPSTVRSKFLPIFSEPNCLGGPNRMLVYALKRWIQVKNWPAVTELILAKAMQISRVKLDGLNLKSVPEQLSGITCQKLDLCSSITQLPQWLTHAKMREIVSIDKKKTWHRHHMLFGESPTWQNELKLICFGDQIRLQEDVLNCLKDKRHKLKLNFQIKDNQPAPAVINVQHDFKMPGLRLYSWTVWSLDDSDPPKRLFFWLDEISRCWSQSNVPQNAQIILVVFGKVFSDIQKKLSRTVYPFFQFDRFKNLTLRAVSVINYFKGYEWFSDSTPFSFNTDSTSTPITGKQVGKISQVLGSIAGETSTLVSPRWVAFSKRLRVVRESIMKWTDFAQMAASCGVGALCGVNPEVDLEMCCDFLADTGSIIHFRHPLWSNSSHQNLSQFVVLKPEWFNKQLSDMTEYLRGITFDNLITAVEELRHSDDTDPATCAQKKEALQSTG
ncbi:hypothetical protein Pelo_8901 [Pelomyxa schiedti]|nr:hypothetical protein Pelo_8901 [Pelomyxa schiedti]